MFCLSIVITPWSCLMHTTLLYVQYFRNILHSSIKSTEVCFDFWSTCKPQFVDTWAGTFLDSHKNSTQMFWCVVKCQGIWAGAGSKVRNSGGQVPYIWTSVRRSGSQCCGNMWRGSPVSRAPMTHTGPGGVGWTILYKIKWSFGDYYGWIRAIRFLIVTVIFYSMLSLFRTLDFLPPMHHL